ncbi:hypothetical protein ACSSVY_000910 [Roseovarius sp. MBR-51]
MSDWYTASGKAESTSNLVPADMPRGPKVETSAHMEITYRDGQSTIVDNSSREYQADQGVNASDGILASARTEGGGLIHNRSLTGKDRVTLPGGMATRVEVAVSLGYLQRNPDGSYSETPMAAAKAAGGSGNGDDGNDDKGSTPAPFTIGDEGEKIMTDIVQSFQPGATIRAMDEIINRGEVSAQHLATMASQAGLEPHQVAEMLNTAHVAFYDAATSHMEALGVTDEDAFEAFVKDHPQHYQALAKGARDLAMSNSTKGLDTVADAFLERADRYMADDVMDALETAGYGHKPDGRGGLLVVLNGGAEVPFQVAVRQKIITFSR